METEVLSQLAFCTPQLPKKFLKCVLFFGLLVVVVVLIISVEKSLSTDVSFRDIGTDI